MSYPSDPHLECNMEIVALHHRIRELEAELAVTGERLDQATAILRDMLYQWDDWTVERVRRGPFSPPINATRAWLEALELENG